MGACYDIKKDTGSYVSIWIGRLNIDKLDSESPAAVVVNKEAVKLLSSNKIKSMSTSVRSRSLLVVPKFTVAEAEKLIKANSKTSTISKGYKLFTVGYIHNIECRAETIGTYARSVMFELDAGVQIGPS